jgi:hypothetical protein
VQFDERYPDNMLQYYPTEQDWTYAPALSPTRVPLEERFLQKYAVNALPIGRGRQADNEIQQTARGQGRKGNQQGRRPRQQGQNTLDGFVTCTGTNLTPLGPKKDKEEGELPDEYDRYFERAASESLDIPLNRVELDKMDGWI